MDGTSFAIGAILLLQVGSLAWTTLLARSTVTKMLQEIAELDSNLAEALVSVTGELPGALEQANPIQLVLSQWIQAQIEAKRNTFSAETVTPKGSDGQFVKKGLPDPEL